MESPNYTVVKTPCFPCSWKLRASGLKKIKRHLTAAEVKALKIPLKGVK
jgi:hypothetical protein